MRPLAEGQTRIYARHAAAFGDVNVYLRSGQGWPISSATWRTPTRRVRTSAPVHLRLDLAELQLWGWGERGNHHGQTLFSARLDLAAGTAYFAYAVGSRTPTRTKSTFTVLLQAIKLN